MLIHRLVYSVSVLFAIWTFEHLGKAAKRTIPCISIEPFVLKDTLTNQEITINKEIFKDYFYVNYCSTVHRCQGETITEAFTIHEWNRMDTKMRYTAISRATSKKRL